MRVTLKALVAVMTADDRTCGVLSLILDMCLMPHGRLCLMAVLLLILGVSPTTVYGTDKPLWLDGHFLLADKPCVSY